MEFAWDEDKHHRNTRERGFGFDFAALIFAGPVIEKRDTRKEYGELRMLALGEAEGIVLAVITTAARMCAALFPPAGRARRNAPNGNRSQDPRRNQGVASQT